MNEENALVTVSQAEEDIAAFELVQRKARLYSSSDLVPKEYKGSIGNCVVAMELSHRLGLPVLQVMQNLYVIHGRPAWKAELIIARINTYPGLLRGRLYFRRETDSSGQVISCQAWGIDGATGEKLDGAEPVTWEMVQRFGWDKREGSMWIKMRGQMFNYRAAAFFARIYCPEILLGMAVEGEVEDVIEAREVSPGRFEVEKEEPGGAAPTASAEAESPPGEADSRPPAKQPENPIPPSPEGDKPDWFYMNAERFIEFHDQVDAGPGGAKAFYDSLDKGLKRAWTNRYNNYVLPNRPPPGAAKEPMHSKPIKGTQIAQIENWAHDVEGGMKTVREWVSDNYDGAELEALSEAEGELVIAYFKATVEDGDGKTD